MRVIIANGGFCPAKNYGGPVVSIDNMCSFLKENIECFVICTNHELGEKDCLQGISEGWNDRGNCKVRYYADNEVNLISLTKVVDEISPDVIYINSLFDAMWTIPLLIIAKKRKLRVLLAPRGQLCKNAFIGKYKKLPYIWMLRLLNLLKNVHFQSTSEEETGAIKQYLKGEDNKIHFLTNLPSLPQHELHYPLKNCGSAKFVFCSRIVPKKNLISAIKHFTGIIGETTFDIYGPIEDKTYWDECQNEVAKLPKNITVSYKGVIDHNKVFQVLSSYDACVFPTWSENFGHVISEALFSGCPVIISDQTPWLNLENNNAGWAIPLDDDKGFQRAIQTIIDCDNAKEQQYRDGAILFINKQFDLDKLKSKYIQALIG